VLNPPTRRLETQLPEAALQIGVEPLQVCCAVQLPVLSHSSRLAAVHW
jgi:ABC-type Fe3+ transport system permease subunit